MADEEQEKRGEGPAGMFYGNAFLVKLLYFLGTLLVLNNINLN